ncbi:5-oxoprolinase subunit PxpA [Aquisalinus flavus]|uniref:UPF0271 protein n=1 Tax=Aquisalinus flavus TaxID=1526572 RepID=A0A8J2V7B4_9PROT|nr:5-oxoprolinase subunit PxpA [Aquisalinus flavus]MBD0425262.1 LamB/YcsF family protein [Aquisalinus flavus]UNE49083.1 LamB/YcsF family protein [Aquisalinus flavus]GGD17469.1 UPF0271 protein [Aquisalinus flavus]
MRAIDLNADLGEYQDGAQQQMEREILGCVSSCNIACGGHTGDELTMRETLKSAREAGVRCGAHPSYPDREGFGRRALGIQPDALHVSLIQQVRDLLAIARDLDVSLAHVKPHGALYNHIADDLDLARLVVGVVKDTSSANGRPLALVGLADSAAKQAAEEAGLAFVGEAFVDRRYTAGGRLQPRDQSGAVIKDDHDRLTQALAIAAGKPVTTCDGNTITLNAQTLCLHGDSPGALATARAVRQALSEQGFTICPPNADLQDGMRD